MTSKPKPKAKRLANAATPQSEAEAARFLAEIGDLEREIQTKTSKADAAIARISEALAETRAPLTDRKRELEQGLQSWCEANRNLLTKGGKRKFFDFGTGKVSWRTRPPKVSIRGADAVIQSLISLGLEHFLRKKVEVNKEAMLNDPDAVSAIKGVSIASEGEDFIIEPAGLELSEA